MHNPTSIPLLLTLLTPLTTAATLLLNPPSAPTGFPAVPDTTDNNENHWCGAWAGAPDPRDAPSPGQLPAVDSTRRYFTEPQLQNPPFQPPMGFEPRVQVPKLWGDNGFRLALLSYATTSPARVYASSKSEWRVIDQARQRLMSTCVAKGSGGAILVPPVPKLTQSTLVLYAYAIGSKFDFTMNYYMSQPYGINPAKLEEAFAADSLDNASASANMTVGRLSSVGLFVDSRRQSMASAM